MAETDTNIEAPKETLSKRKEADYVKERNSYFIIKGSYDWKII